jgi:excisionase family DNA binding protein
MKNSDSKPAPTPISCTPNQATVVTDRPATVPIALPPEEAAVVIGRSRSRIFKAIKDKELTARKDGKATLLEIEELRRWVRALPTVGRQPDNELTARKDGLLEIEELLRRWVRAFPTVGRQPTAA